MAARKKLPTGIRMKNGSYEARASVNGIKINLYGTDLEKLIEEFEFAKKQARQKIDYLNSDLTLDQWYEEWFTNVKSKRVKETSVNTMKNAYKRTFGFYLGSKKLRQIDAMDLQKAVNAMHEKGISVKTIRNTLGHVRESFQFAVGNKLISSNPCLIVEVPWTFKRTEEEVALTQEEQNDFLSYMDDNWYKELFYFMLLTGVRVGEVGGIRWRDIDFTNKIININCALSSNYENGKKIEKLVDPKTVNSVRKIPFMGEMEEILKSQQKKQKKLKKDLGKRWRGKEEFKDLIFTTTMGSPCSRYVVDKEIKKYVKRRREEEAYRAIENRCDPKEIRSFHPHTLRHTFATRCFENKMEPKVVQKLMGHSSISVTLNIYTHVLEDLMETEIEKFGLARTDIKEENPFIDINMPSISAHTE